MNLIGKIFVAIILLMSIIFMMLAMATYATHKNWQTAYDRVDGQLKQKTAELQRKASAFDLEKQELEQQLAATTQEITNLLTARGLQDENNVNLSTEINQLKQERRDATAAVSSTQANAERLAKANVTLQEDVIAAQQARDRAFEKTVAATASLHDAEVKLQNELELTSELTEKVAGMTRVMEAEGLDPDTRVGDVKPRIGGFVSSIRRRAGDETIEITIGSDDGLKAGHTVEVYRMTSNASQSKWLGRAEVLSTNGDRAFARVIPELKKARIQEGDRVATRFN